MPVRPTAILRAFGFVALGCIGIATVGFFAAIALIIMASKPEFDQSHPDYAAFADVFDQAERALNAGERYVLIDLAPLNGGAWKTACLFSGYTRPVEHMERLGAKVDQADRDRLGEPQGFRAAPVEESELVIAFMDEEGRAHFVHFQRGIGQHTQHHWECVMKPETKLAASVSSIPGRTTLIPQGE
jgi:hypothetical protein